MKNNLINSIDLKLNSAEVKSLISDVKLSIAFVVDSNHTSNNNDLGVGEILAKSPNMTGTSELSDSVYKPINPNITHYPLAGEFVLVMETSIGRYYLTTVNLFNDKTNNIDVDNVYGYVSFTDDENTNKKQISSDRKAQKSVLENNEAPFNERYDRRAENIRFGNKFGDVNIFGRFGNEVKLTSSEEGFPEMLLDNGVSSVELRNGSFSYNRKSINVQPTADVNSDIQNVYTGQQVYMTSDRIFMTAGNNGIIQETSGRFSTFSDGDISMYSFQDVRLDGALVELGRSASDRVAKGDTFMRDFKKMMDSMVRFAENLAKQDRILSLSHAANNFLTDINSFGWDDFDENIYLSKKVYVE